jgi:uncharacterized protein GlcG (DUF336 family)
MRRSQTALTLISALGLAAAAVPASAQFLPPPPFGQDAKISAALITRAEATSIAQDTIASCERQKETATVLVIDANGFLRAALTSDEGTPIGLRSASLKAATVLKFHESTRALGEKIAADKAFAAQYEKDEHYFWHPGAVPLFRAGKFVGVVAAGGGHDKDESCVLEALGKVPALKVKP